MVKYISYELGDGAKRPYKKYSGDAGWDLFICNDCVIPSGETVDIHTNIKIQLPHGYYARITGRSSSLRKHNLLVNEGIIDNGYTGELFVCVHNVGAEDVALKKGMRVAQILIHKIEDVRWSEVDHIDSDTDRGNNGFGSTGR